jgi:hypothetical protein
MEKLRVSGAHGEEIVRDACFNPDDVSLVIQETLMKCRTLIATSSARSFSPAEKTVTSGPGGASLLTPMQCSWTSPLCQRSNGKLGSRPKTALLRTNGVSSRTQYNKTSHHDTLRCSSCVRLFISGVLEFQNESFHMLILSTDSMVWAILFPQFTGVKPGSTARRLQKLLHLPLLNLLASDSLAYTGSNG